MGRVHRRHQAGADVLEQGRRGGLPGNVADARHVLVDVQKRTGRRLRRYGVETDPGERVVQFIFQFGRTRT